ncbi:MAG: hypothetical protein HY040_12615 [Planctomycetes bacterium]|nr:hypothetical protein [Planctomycetota bacterium]
MLKRCILGAVALCLAMGSYALTGPAPQTRDGDEQRIGDLVKQLGSNKFAERNQAQKELEAIGAPALDTLRKAAKDGDLETTKRAGDLVRKLEERIFTANLLIPKRVHLKVKDMPVLDAVAELSRLSGYPVQVQGDRTKVGDKTVTLDTGDVTFWEALDKLCEKSGLTENTQFNPNNPYNANVPGGFGLMPAPANIRAPLKFRNAAPAVPGVIQAVPAKEAPKPAPDAKPEAKAAGDGKREAKPAGDAKPAGEAKPAGDIKPAQATPKKEAKQADPKDAPDAKQQAKVQALADALDKAQLRAQLEAVVQAAQAAQAAQVKGQPVQVQFVPVQGGPGDGGFGPVGRPGVGTPGQITLIPGTHKNDLVSYAGAVRVRVLPTPDVLKKQGDKAGQYIVIVDVAGELKLQSFNVTNNVTLEKAVDDQGQMLSLTANMPMGNGEGGGNPVAPAPAAPGGFVILGGLAGSPSPYAANRQVVVRLKAGEKQAKALKELVGSVAATVQAPPEALITVDNVLKAAGTTTKGKTGGSLEVSSIDKMGEGEYKVQFKMETPAGNNAWGAMPGNGAIQFQAVQIQGNIQIQQLGGPGGRFGQAGNAPGTPELIDAKGNKYEIANVPNRRFNFNNGVGTQEMTVVYRAANGAGEPDRLVVNGSRMVTITIPFAFRDVPLP